MRLAGRISFGSWLHASVTLRGTSLLATPVASMRVLCAALLLFSSLVSCARIGEKRSRDERAVLASSSFIQGALSASVRSQIATTSLEEGDAETGVIKNPNAPGNGGNDGGTVGGPGTNPGTGNNPGDGNDPGDTAGNNPPGGTTNPPGGTTNPGGNNPPGDNDGGTIGGPGNDPGGEDGGTIGQGDEDCDEDVGRIIRYELWRVCTWHGGYGFFEEARRPVLSIETDTLPTWCPPELEEFCGSGIVDPLRWKGTGYPMAQPQRRSVVLGRRDLTGVNLFQDRHRGAMSISLRNVHQAYGNSWKNMILRTRVCDDNDGRGCLGRSREQTMSVIEMLVPADQIPPEFALEVLNGRIGYNPAYYSSPPAFCERIISPLVLDLEGNGISLSGPFEGVRFDIENRGRPEPTGWTLGTDDAFLVYDRNGNGRIDSGGELFGSATEMKDGQRAANGFEALKEFDTNADGQFSPADEAWNRMALWIDANRNGMSEAGELKPLGAYSLQSIHLAYIDSNEIDENGNQTRQRSTFRRLREGISQVALVIDVWFRTLTAN